MTDAQQIAEMFDNDGQCFDCGDLSIAECCQAVPGVDATEDADSTRYEFPDASVITITNGGWDFGHVGCMCWQGADDGNHMESCEAAS